MATLNLIFWPREGWAHVLPIRRFRGETLAKKDEGPDRRREVLGAGADGSVSLKDNGRTKTSNNCIVLGGYEGIRPQLMLKLLKLGLYL